ncbi:MAG: hypothetical protein JOZ10_15895 [Acidobacteria bacterium]|nr:hypothetical protein [Acidobacteriota bacterium]MBV9145936.1 hypothetical protein [Acidobacteriota bacterium]MBV9437678.1 hypothetical protein [Acidobacteriota bacterium]
MNRLAKAAKEFYTEAEAAAELKISVERLHNLLDRKLFNDGSSRPPSVSFQTTDLILLRFWLEQDQPKLIQMPARSMRMPTGTADIEG